MKIFPILEYSLSGTFFENIGAHTVEIICNVLQYK
jgi:hypothetical protein